MRPRQKSPYGFIFLGSAQHHQGVGSASRLLTSTAACVRL